MAELVNSFSWSISAAQAFDECRRRRYWSKYAMWGGWKKTAAEEAQAAYRLTKMDTIYTLQGKAAEQAVMWVLREHQLGNDVSAEDAYEKIARPMLNQGWKQSKSGAWKDRPKQNCCLLEHYYERWTDEEGTERAKAMKDYTIRCINNFIERILPRIGHVTRAQELFNPEMTMGGDPESFELEGIKIYSIPDYVYLVDGTCTIHDWKAGKSKPELHTRQILLYAVWANRKHGIPYESMAGFVEYLGLGQVLPVEINEESVQEVLDYVEESVADMTGYLQNGDRERNCPVAKEEWDLAADPQTCQYCPFYELCLPEL